jgi:hypothetical protein
MLKKTKEMVMSGDENAGRTHDIKIDNSSFERVEHLTYCGRGHLNCLNARSWWF